MPDTSGYSAETFGKVGKALSVSGQSADTPPDTGSQPIEPSIAANLVPADRTDDSSAAQAFSQRTH